MPKKKPKKKGYARVSVTLPREVLALADRLAAQLDRSRSWVIAEALRGHAARPSLVREAVASPYESATVAEARALHLQADLRRGPEERLRRGEELVQLARLVHPRRSRVQILGFETLEDFAAWKKARRVGL